MWYLYGKSKEKGTSLHTVEAKIIYDADAVEEVFLENQFVQGLISFIAAFIVYLIELSLYSISIYFAAIGFVVIRVVRSLVLIRLGRILY